MRANFSELQFAYGITREIEDELVFAHVGVPYFPTLNEEGDAGYDVRFGNIRDINAVFLQYKRPYYLSRRNAKEYNLFHQPYFRFKIYPQNVSNQHNLLIDLAEDYDRVYYCSAAFHLYPEYLEYHDNRTLSTNSAFIPLRGLDRVNGNDEHCIVYAKNPERHFMCSEPKFVKGIYGWENLKQDLIGKNKTYSNVEEFIYNISPFVEKIASDKHSITRQFDSNITQKLIYLAEVLLAELNVSLLLIR